MSKKIQLAVASAVLAMGASAAQAGITIPAGDWTIDIGGNVNAFYTHTSFNDSWDLRGVANKGNFGYDSANTVQTGLLPSALGVGGKTRQNDLDIAFQFTFFVGSDAGSGQALGNNSLNIRQAYLTFGDKSWGSIKAGRDLGIFGSDAILSDMTLLGVGIGAGHGGSSTLGRIGSGYQYADWVGQISYTSPNWNGFSFAVGIREPWSNGIDNTRSNLGYEGKVSYEWGGDVSGKVWLGGINQNQENGHAVGCTGVYTLDPATGNIICTAPTVSTVRSHDAHAWEIGGKVNVGGFGLVGYYYDGSNISGTTANILGNLTLNGGNFFNHGAFDTDDKGGYVQLTYTAPFGTKFGLSWGESKSDPSNRTCPGCGEFKNESWMIGVYHPLTKSLNLVAEYVDHQVENIGYTRGPSNTVDGEARTISLGAIMFF